MSHVWVICIKFDYGVWDEAGWFKSRQDALAWIEEQRRHNRQRVEEVGRPGWEWDGKPYAELMGERPNQALVDWVAEVLGDAS